ncbi:MAG TPA: cobalamin-binding protein, partial [Chitinophagales bacterium]|nr:cobalamin-binding protein [Chitinophagales bacterium]
VFLSSEPYPFEEKHIREFQTMLPNTKIILVDGTYFSWYGSKMKDAPKYYQQLAEKISAVS